MVRSMRLLLHIGATKTGSSALQQTLSQQRAALGTQGILYSSLTEVASAHHLLVAALHPNAWRLHGNDLPDDRGTYFSEMAAAMLAEARARRCHTLIVSSEYCWSTFDKRFYETFAAGFPGCTFEIVAFVRRPDHWAVSSYLQAVKGGEDRDFGPWVEELTANPRSRFYFHEVIRTWHDRLEAARSHVLVYEKDVVQNVFRAFCEATSLEGVDVAVTPGRANPSPNANGLGLLLAVNRSDLSAEEKQRRRSEIMREPKNRGSGAGAAIADATLRRHLLQLSIASNQRILRDFLPARKGPLFTEPWPALPKIAPVPG